MKSCSILSLLLLPLLALAQNPNSSQQGSGSQSAGPSGSQNPSASGNASPTAAPITSTFITRVETTSVGVVSGQTTTQVRTLNVLTTAVVQPGSGNDTASPTSATSSTTPRNLPTAPTDIDGGGGAGPAGGAPIPGATGVGGAFGPDDGYIAAATSLKRNAFYVGLTGLFVGGGMLVL